MVAKRVETGGRMEGEFGISRSIHIETDKQHGPTVWHRELYLKSCGKP